MNELLEVTFSQLIRVSLITSVLVIVMVILVRLTRLKPSMRVAAWMFVLLQCWFLGSIALEIPWYEPLKPEVIAMPAASFELPIDLQILAQQMSKVPEEPAVPFFPVLVLTVWVIGGLVLVLKYARSFKTLSKVVGLCRCVDESNDPYAIQWIEELEDVRCELGVAQGVQLRLSKNFGPLICRISGEYSLVVPEPVWSEISKEHRLIILRHELVHLKRRDIWKVLVARLFVLPQWFNPLAWLALRRFDAAIEMACDDYVLEHTSASPVEYAKSLVSLIEFNYQPSGIALAIGGPPVQKRILRIVQPKGLEMKFARMLTFVSLLSISVIGLLKLELVAQEAESPAASQAEKSGVVMAKTDQLKVVSNGKSKPNDGSDRVLMKSYYIGDLVIPKQHPVEMVVPPMNPKAKFGPVAQQLGGVTLQDFEPIKDLVTSTIEPDSWKPGGGSSIEVFVPNLNLIIGTTKEKHEKIEELLTKVRELSSVSVELEPYLVIVPDGHELTKELSLQTPQPFTEKAIEKYARREGLKFTKLPKRSLYNGQVAICLELKTGRSIQVWRPGQESPPAGEIERFSMGALFVYNLSHNAKETVVKASLFTISGDQTPLYDKRNNGGKAIVEPVEQTHTKMSKAKSPTDENQFASEQLEVGQAKPKAGALLPQLKMSGLMEVSKTACSRFDVTEFLKKPNKGKRAILVVQSEIVDKRGEIAKIPAPKLLNK